MTHLKKTYFLHGLLIVSGLFVMGVVILASMLSKYPVAVFTKDPLALYSANPLTGAVSNLGAVLWCVTLGACALAWAETRRAGAQPTIQRFLLYVTCLTALLMVDDLFMVHEWLVPHYLGISEKVPEMAYMFLGIGYLLIFRRVIWNTDKWMLAEALVFFALTGMVDIAFQNLKPPSVEYALEDGFKLLGILCWTGYHFKTSLQLIRAPLLVSEHPDQEVPRPAGGPERVPKMAYAWHLHSSTNH